MVCPGPRGCFISSWRAPTCRTPAGPPCMPNYPSPRALKLADTDLQNPSALVREAAIQSVVGLVPGAQRSLLLGPVLEDREQAVRFDDALPMFRSGQRHARPVAG